MPAIVEATTLPVIQAKAKGSEWQAYVNAYVIDAKRALMANGSVRQGLWYLSYVLPKGQGAIAQAIFNTFVSNTGSKDLFLEGIGGLSLGSHRQDLVTLGYKVPWTVHMDQISPEAIQYVIEPRGLTTFDPQLSETGRKKGKSKGKGAISLSTASSGSFEDEEGEDTRREQKPMFLLLIPGRHKGDPEYREQLHWTYLRKRCPFDLCEEWSSFLWERAVREGEVRELDAWSYTYQARPKDEDFAIPSSSASSSLKEPGEEEQESPFQAVLSQAYLCLPNIEGIHTALTKRLDVTQEVAEREEVAA